jgi:hypothetical protein
MGKTNLREVLEAIGSTQDGMTEEKDAVALLDMHLKEVQGCQHTDALEDLVKVRDGAKRALDITFKVRTDSQLARSHAEPLVQALAPLERLIERLQKEVPKEAPKGPKAQPPKNEPKVEKAPPIPDNLPPAQKSVREAMRGGKLKEKLAEPEFELATQEWMAKADPSDPEQRKDMLSVLKAIDPAKRAERQKAFEQTFNAKVKSDEYKAELLTTLDRSTKPPSRVPKLDKDGNRQYNLGKSIEAPVNPVALEMMADIMGELPPEHMPKQWVLTGQDDPTKLGTGGSYNDETDNAQLTFSLADVLSGGKHKYSGNCDPQDPLHGADAFDLLVRHECGHKAGLSLKSRSLTDQASSGGWTDHGQNMDAVLAEMGTEWAQFVTAVQGSHGAPAEAAIKNTVKAAIEQGLDAAAMADELKIGHDRIPDDAALLKLLRQALGGYLMGSSPASSGDRIFIVGGPDRNWFSFSKSSWKNKVSYYQYATPEEWFAEFYAAANNKTEGIRKAAKQRYPDAWAWMKEKGCVVFPE